MHSHRENKGVHHARPKSIRQTYHAASANLYPVRGRCTGDRSPSFSSEGIGANTDILREGDRPNQSCLVVEGCLYRFNVVANGKRQVLSFNYPSDIPDLQSFHLGKMDHNLGTLTKSVVAFMPHDSLAELTDHHPRIAACLWRESHVDAAIGRQWIVNLGRRSALSRVAHLLCEQALRLKQIGLGDETGFPWFFTQAVLADATGLSVVHVNRTFQELRTKRLVGAYDSKRLTILDWEGLVRAAEFEPTYLHLDPLIK